MAIRDSITEIRDARRAAERDRAQRARLAADQARAAWVQAVRDAITQGNLIGPQVGSAQELLAEKNSWSAERSQLTAELLTAIADTAKADINAGHLEGVEAFKNAKSPASVAKVGYDAMINGKLIAINQFSLKFLLYWVIPFLPRRLVLKMSRQSMEKSGH